MKKAIVLRQVGFGARNLMVHFIACPKPYSQILKRDYTALFRMEQPHWKPIGAYRTTPLPILPIPPNSHRRLRLDQLRIRPQGWPSRQTHSPQPQEHPTK
jgi:hypothetical protein